MSSLFSSKNIITHFPVIGEQEKSVSVLSWRDELELESGIGEWNWRVEPQAYADRASLTLARLES